MSHQWLQLQHIYFILHPIGENDALNFGHTFALQGFGYLPVEVCFPQAMSGIVQVLGLDQIMEVSQPMGELKVIQVWHFQGDTNDLYIYIDVSS